jgi:hypothetical protein
MEALFAGRSFGRCTTDIAIVAAVARAPLHTHFCQAKILVLFFGFAFVALRSLSSSVASF